MEQSHCSGLEREQRLDEIVTAYLKAVEQGQGADRREWLERHPELATDLEEFFQEQDRLEHFAAPLRGGLAIAAREDAERMKCPELLGDFRIVREVGRGGMGVVYEAEQVSLRRRAVALKVLPFAATAWHSTANGCNDFATRVWRRRACTTATSCRFTSSAANAAFTSMPCKFIAERSNWPPPCANCAGTLGCLAPRREARRSQRGWEGSRPTVASPKRRHRDQRKRWDWRDCPPRGARSEVARSHCLLGGPAGRSGGRGTGLCRTRCGGHSFPRWAEAGQHDPVDDLGVPWLTDFGLAQMQHGEGSLTMTGDLVGTLRYMSPEQALAKRVVIDHRTDVYSLGATLYELLTLRPAFGGSDRQELLRQVAFEEPIPLRRLDKSIPAELETIVLKTLEKNPADRYVTAKELADDLRRFLDDQPIKARRPSLRQRLRKWARRHRTAVTAAAIWLLVSLAALAGSAGWVLRDRAARGTETEQAVNAALDEGVKWQQEGRLPEALAATRRAVWLVDTGVASAALRQRVQARRDDLELLEKLENVRLEMTAGSKGHFDYARGNRRYGETFRGAGLDVETLPPEQVGQSIRTSTVAVEVAAALDDWAWIRRRHLAPEDTSWKRLLRVARAADPDEGRTRLRNALEQGDRKALIALAAPERAFRLLPPTLCTLSHALHKMGANQEAVALLREAQRRHPDDFWINTSLALAFHRSQPRYLEENLRFYTVALALRPSSPGAHVNLGVALWERGGLEEAITEYREALRLKEDYPMAHSNLGVVLQTRARWTKHSWSSARPWNSNPGSPMPTPTSASPYWRRARWMRQSPSTARPSRSRSQARLGPQQPRQRPAREGQRGRGNR